MPSPDVRCEGACQPELGGHPDRYEPSPLVGGRHLARQVVTSGTGAMPGRLADGRSLAPVAPSKSSPRTMLKPGSIAATNLVRSGVSPAAFRPALTDRLRGQAASGRWTLAQLQRQMAYDRLLERLYLVDEQWIR